MEGILVDKARELGRTIGQTDEYKALQRARTAISEDRETVTLLNRLGELEREITTSLQRGQEPAAELREEYESTFGSLQSQSAYQRLAAAQSNFDKILARVNEEIEKGMQAAAQSRIILPS